MMTFDYFSEAKKSCSYPKDAVFEPESGVCGANSQPQRLKNGNIHKNDVGVYQYHLFSGFLEM